MKKNILFLFIFLCFSGTFCYAQKNLKLISKIGFPGRGGAGCWHYVDTTGKEYAIAATQTSIAIVDISNPAAPKIKSEIPVPKSIWQEVCVWGKYAYCGTEAGGGITIINLSKLPASVSSKKYTGDGAIAGKLGNSHTVKAYNGYLYINGANAITKAGTIICSLADPLNPKYVGKYDKEYVHDCDFRNDTLYTSQASSGLFAVVDVKSKAAPKLLATQATPFKVTHNSALSDNSKVIYVTDEVQKAPVTAWDISDLGNITLLDKYYTVELPMEEVHNVRVLNDYLVNACYGGQVTIVDGHKPDNLVEVANFRTDPVKGKACWDVDPYLPSGLVLALENTDSAVLFIFKPTYQRACYLEGTVTDSLTGKAIYAAKVELLTTKIIDSTVLSGNYKTGYPDAGTYNVRFSKPGYITRTINGVKLTGGNVTTLNVKLLKGNVAVDENEYEDAITLYPNPSPGNLHLKVNGSMLTDLTFILYDILGVEKQRELIPNSQTGLNIRNLSTGVYMCRIIDKNGNSLKEEKVVIVR